MKKVANWGLLIFTLLFVSCSFEREKNKFLELEKSDKVFNLKGEKFYFPEIINPLFINAVGDYLIISENRRNDPKYPLIRILKKSPLGYHSSKGKSGFGPFEIPDATLVEPGKNDSTFTVYSGMAKTFTDFSLTDTSLLGIDQYKQPEGMFEVYNMFHATDSTIIGIKSIDENRLVEISLKDGDKIAGFGNWEKIPDTDHLIDYTDPIVNYHLGEINKGWFRGNREVGLFVKASIYRDRIEIFDYNEKEFTIVEGPRLELPKFEIVPSGANSVVIFDIKNKYGHRDVYIDDKYIYDLYGGFNEEEIQKTNVVAKTVYILTHSGDVVGKLNLDISIRGMVVDLDLKKIYGITTDEDPGIAVFDLPSEFL